MTALRRLLCGAALLWACAAQAALPQVGQAVAPPALAIAGGGTLAPAAWQGKVVVLAWFASWCPYCMQEAPKLQRLSRDNPGKLLVVGVNVEQDDPAQAAKVRQWIGKYRWSFPVVLDARALEGAVGKPKGIPALVVVDRTGKVRQVEAGELLDEDFDDIAAYARTAP